MLAALHRTAVAWSVDVRLPPAVNLYNHIPHPMVDKTQSTGPL